MTAPETALDIQQLRDNAGAAGQLLKALEVGERVPGQVVERARTGRVRLPSGQGFVHRDDAGKIVGRGRGQLEPLAIQIVVGAHPDLVVVVEAIEVGHGKPVDAIDHAGIAEQDRIAPPAPARPSGGGTKLAAQAVQVVGDAGILGRERAFADTGRVGLGHAHHTVDPMRRHARPGARTPGRRVRRCHVRIGAVVDVEVGALRSFEQNGHAGLQSAVQVRHGIRQVREQDFCRSQYLGHHLVRRGYRQAGLGEQTRMLPGLLGDMAADQVGLGQVGHAQSATQDLVGIGGADAAPGRADPARSAHGLAGPVLQPVERQRQVRAVGNLQLLRVHMYALPLEPGDFIHQAGRIHHHTVADDTGLAVPKDAGGNEVQDELHAPADDRVSGVVAALRADDDFCGFREKIDDLTFAFVTPLGADDDGVGHGVRRSRGHPGIGSARTMKETAYGPTRPTWRN